MITYLKIQTTCLNCLNNVCIYCSRGFTQDYSLCTRLNLAMFAMAISSSHTVSVSLFYSADGMFILFFFHYDHFYDIIFHSRFFFFFFQKTVNKPRLQFVALFVRRATCLHFFETFNRTKQLLLFAIVHTPAGQGQLGVNRGARFQIPLRSSGPQKKDIIQQQKFNTI